MPDVSALVEQTQTSILEGCATPVHFSFEYLDFSSSLADSYRKRETAWRLRNKYRGQIFDLVVAIGTEASVFAEQARTKLLPEAAVLFYVVNPGDASTWGTKKPGRTGVIRKVNYLPTLQLALRQNPGTYRVIVVSGSSNAEKLEVKIAHQQFHEYESNLEFQYVTELEFAELGPRLAQVQPDSVILFLNFETDSTGENFIPARILPSITKSASRPVYGTLSSFVGGGVVGGSVADLGEVGRTLGHNGVRILRGEKPETIPVATGDFQHYVIDWRQLRRWGIPESQLPPDSGVLFWEYSPWELYRGRILGLSALLLIETLLIVLLLRNIAKRKRAQEALHRKEEELAEAQRFARLGNWRWDPKKGSLTWSEELYRIHGLDPSFPPPSGRELEQLFTPESWGRLNAAMEKALQTASVPEIELELVRPDGSIRWITTRGEAVRDAAGVVSYLRGTAQDITERKQADEARFRLASIVESSDDAIISKNLNGIIMSWNLGAQHIFGFTEAEAVGQPIAIIVPPELRGESNMILQKTRAGETVEHYETERMTKAGKSINVSLTISPLRDANGRVIGASKIARDITERKRAGEELKKSEEKFAKAFHQSPMALSLVSATTNRYIEVNDTFERLSGYARAEVIGKSALEVGLGMNPVERAKLTRQLMLENSYRDVECEFHAQGGRILIGSASAELIEIGGEPCILEVVADVTDRKRAEQSLVESEKRFRLMADSAPMLIWLSGPDKLGTDFNKEWLKFTGRSKLQELGEGWTHNIHRDDLRHHLEVYSRAFEEKEKFISEYRMRRHDGQFRWMLDRGAPRFLDDGTFAGYVGCCIDITDQKEAKAALVELTGRLIQSGEEERGRVARELHDDINQRLALLANQVQEFSQTTSANWDSVQKEQLQELWKLTNEIATDIHHISHQLHPSKLQYLGLATAVRDLCHEFSRQHKIELECTVRDMPQNLEEGASLSLFRIAQESLRNVVKHSRARHVRVELTGQSSVIRLCVSDDGIGFNPEHVSSYQGLGLVSMRERLRFVGGEFSIWSKPSLGTRVEATIPLPAPLAREQKAPPLGKMLADSPHPTPVSSDSSRPN